MKRAPLGLYGDTHMRATVALVALVSCAAACTSDWDALRGGGARDAGADVLDVPDDRGDAGLDAAADVARDAVADADASAPADVADARADVTLDVSTDARADVTLDAPADVRADVAVDVVTPPRCRPTIDGAIGADWTASAALASNTTATLWGVGVNELRTVRVCVDETSLFLGVEGIAESTNAILAFIDRDDGAATGIVTGASFADRTGMLDGAISSLFGAFPAGVGVDMVWGTRGMSSHHGAVVDGVGLRDVRTNAADYGWIAGDDTACSAAAGGACEVSIPWTALYGAAGRPSGARLSVFLRLGNGDGTMASNQTLPQDAPATPYVVSRVLRVETGP